SRQPEKKPRADRFGMPPLANPYDLSTWQAERTGPRTGRPEPQDQDRRRSERHGQATARTERPGPATSGDGRGEPTSFSPVDPGDLPTPDDPCELARRTISRSRAAARDRGLFPTSAKTQARDVRDRSRGAPGYSGARPDPRDPQGIGLILRRVLSDLGWNAGMNSGRVLAEWDEIVGERLATHCRPVSFEDGVLVVSASSSAWAAQLRLLTPQLVTTIEEHVGSHVVS